MDINVLIETLKSEIGLLGVMNNIYDDSVIKNSILNISLKEFSRWSSFIIDFPIDGIVQNFESRYDKFNLEIDIPEHLLKTIHTLGSEIKKVYFSKIPNYPIGNYYFSRGMKDDILMYSAQQTVRINYEEPKFAFRAPRTIIVYNYSRFGSLRPYCAWLCKVECTHPRNLSTITSGLESLFIDLCKYDLMINMWNSELRFMNADVGSAQITADVLDNFRNAESDRKDLIDRLRKKNAIDHISFIF